MLDPGPIGLTRFRHPGSVVSALFLNTTGDANSCPEWITVFLGLEWESKVGLKEPSPHSSPPDKWETLSPHILSKRNEDEPGALTFSRQIHYNVSRNVPISSSSKSCQKDDSLRASVRMGGMQRRHAAGRSGDDLPRVGDHTRDHLSGSQWASAVPARLRQHNREPDRIGLW